MIRCAFNGGELSPTSAVRADLDNFHRGASKIENMDLGQMGGVSRRRGFRRVIAALDGSIILPYIYSTNDRYLVEVSPSLLRVLSVDGDVVASLPSSWTVVDVPQIRHKQVNSMLFLACPTHELMVLKRDNDGVFSLAPYEFKSRPWRYEEYRDFPVRMTLDNGRYRLSFGDHAGDPDAATNKGDVMRVQVTVPQQTGYKTSTAIVQGWVIAKAFTAASAFTAGKKLCVNEGSYWSWWTCDKDFNGRTDFVAGLTSPADYPDHFHKGIVCHNNVITCKGTWTFYCYKEWYGTYAVERRYPDEDWQLLGTSNSKVGAASNLQLTGDEAGEECYLRLMIYETQLSSATDPSQGFPLSACGNKLIVDAYRKDVVLQLHSDANPASVSTSDVLRFSLPLTPDAYYHFDKRGLPRVSALVIDGVRHTVPCELVMDGPQLVVKPTGLTTNDIAKGKKVRIEWAQAAESFDANADRRAGSTTIARFIPAGTVVTLWGWSSVYAGREVKQPSLLLVCKGYSPTGGSSFSSVFSAQETGVFAVTQDGFCAVSLYYWSEDNVRQRSRAKMQIPACTAWCEAQVSELTASAEYSLWDNVSAIPEGVPPSGESLMWSFAAFRGVYGFPSLVDVFQQRLVLAATRAQPQTVWLSKTDDLNNFEVGKQDDSALALTLSTTTQNRICWMMAQSSRLMIGTADAEWVLSGGQGVMTASNARADNHGYVGSSDVPALMATDKVLYIERGGGRVYQYGYDYESDGYVSRDLTVFADHILADGGGCRDIAFLRKPEPRAVFVRQDGHLALMSYNSMHQVNAWHRYTTDGAFEGVVALPNGNKADLLFALVTRGDERFIEVLAPDNEFQDPDGRDYVSTLETNALISPEAAGRRQHSSSVMFYFGSDTLAGGVEVSIDGERWDELDRAPSSFLERGWHSLVADGCWNYDSMVGIRVSGNRDFNLLAIQA